MKIIPAILATDVHDFDELVETALKLPGVERIQVDFIYEEFSNETTGSVLFMKYPSDGRSPYAPGILLITSRAV